MAELMSNSKIGGEDDFALEAIPEQARMPWSSILNVTMGIVGAMIFMQLGGEMALTYGSVNAILAMVYATAMNAVLAIILAFFAAKTGLNAGLLTRGTGYGFVGAALTSLLYASNFIVLAATEGSIMSHAVHTYLPSIPLWLIMLILGAGIIPLSLYGMKQINKFQRYSLPVYIVLLISGIVVALHKKVSTPDNWLTFSPHGQMVGGAALLTCIGIFNGIIGGQTLLTADYARFIKPKEIRFAPFIIGFVPQLGSYLIMGMVGIWFAVRFAQSDPGVYMVFVLGVGGTLYTVLTQLRINLINIYSGSLGLANFFGRIFKFTPGRVFWVIVTAGIAVVSMLSNIIAHIGVVLTFQGVSMFAWTASMLADLLVVKKVFKIGPSHVEYRRGYLRDWNPVGPIALLVGSAVGLILAISYVGTIASSISAFIAGGIAFVLHIALAMATKGKYYVVSGVRNGEGLLDEHEAPAEG
ncbi:purine-cytosine permease family protein [Alicyclobacillus acidoterrestris]|uniref:Permease n=1 Tax=Alicyclobacillus acidoterrestris (strain ATCC 49025 / DSM 3922 / CIP 106132 / NCIMB 13137 / GD3B) TaxID=1356854 RepID=T0C0J0_ALIAG|nr:hypothetical protein [Alicyclobacillus acidoterrestris]EPZ46130.1 hypothetical protein N007_07580 [Alicyclobacillus acidoterrestris ATCC 49025]UNO48501.1 permease [Alicyclobacillus acidoterrestris]